MSTFKEEILDIIFPRHCLGCDILLGNKAESYICHPCFNGITFTNGFACAFCRSPVRAGKTCVYCIRNHSLDRLLVASSYGNPLIEKITKTIKYRFVGSLAKNVAELMSKYLKKKVAWLVDFDNIIVIPTPLHRSRLNWRGFNQAEILASGIAQFFGWPLAANLLKRVRNSHPQADMPDRLSRIENVRNMFECPTQDKASKNNQNLAGRNILLIDDISTTASTLDDCARALKAAGAKEVIGFVFARGKTDSY